MTFMPKSENKNNTQEEEPMGRHAPHTKVVGKAGMCAALTEHRVSFFMLLE